MLLLLLAGLALAAPDKQVLTVEPPAVEEDAGDLPEADEAPVDARSGRRVQLLYTGARRGVGSGRYLFELLRHLRDAAAATDASLAHIESVHGVLAQEPWLLRSGDHRVEGVLAFLDGTDLRCGPPEPVSAIDTGVDVLVMDWEAPPAAISALSERAGPTVSFSRRSCTNAAGTEAVLLSPAGVSAMPDWDPSAWEFRKSLRGGLAEGDVEHPFLVVGRPIQEASRTFARIAQLRADQPGALYVDAGSFVDGASSVKDGELSLHRPLGYQMLARLAPSAVAPGDTELIAGAEAFHAEVAGVGLPYIATNWDTTDEAAALQLPPFRVETVQTPDGELRVGFISILDPELATAHPQIVADGVKITDPVETVQPVVDALHALDAPPDVVIALTTAGPLVQSRVRRELRGVDLMLGDTSFATLRVSREDVRVDHVPADQKAAPLTLALDGLAAVELQFDGPEGQLDALSMAPLAVAGEGPFDAEVRGAVTRTRAQTYPPLDRPLLPAPTDDPTGTWRPDQWAKMVCEAVRLRTDADSVLLGEIPPPPRTPGALSEMAVVDQLAQLDQIEEHRIPGDAIQKLLDRAYGHVPVACGAVPGGTPLIDGRPFDVARVYRVVSTDLTRRATPLGGIIDPNRVSRPWDGPPTAVLTTEDGRPLTLRQAVLDAMRFVRDTNGGPARVASVLLSFDPTHRPPRWFGRIRQAALQVERFEGTGTDVFAAVPETLATSPSSFTLGSTGDVSLEYSDKRVAGDLRFKSAYTKITSEGTEDLDGDGQPDPIEAETADDWQLSTTWAAVGLYYPRETPLQFAPYTELRFDSEYTPIEAEDGTENPRQSDLSLALGVAARKWGMLQVWRIGAFANRDMAQLDEKPTEYGGRTDFELVKSLGPALRWSLLGDVQVYANTSDDDPSDLRLRAFGETRLALPLARYLEIAGFAQGFALQGRVPETNELGTSTNVGVALQSAGAFRLDKRR